MIAFNDGEDYECVSVLYEHTQDVKCVRWHPHDGVWCDVVETLVMLVTLRMKGIHLMYQV